MSLIRQFDWWTLLEPYLTDRSRKETKAAHQQARKDLEHENKACLAKSGTFVPGTIDTLAGRTAEIDFCTTVGD
ncbi:MAG: hypothetical protein DMF05_08865 [Verrucomicrobia bacterium]|jgi:hypothetical protein|nr:MAG: hypothetical protein DMF05_08865 [Verrucomicrobiota bacterium]